MKSVDKVVLRVLTGPTPGKKDLCWKCGFASYFWHWEFINCRATGSSVWEEKGWMFLEKLRTCWVQWPQSLILASWEAEIQRITFQDQLGQKVRQIPIFTSGWGMMVWACHPSRMGSRDGRLMAQTGPSIKQDSVSKVILQKGLVEWLKLESLSSKREGRKKNWLVLWVNTNIPSFEYLLLFSGGWLFLFFLPQENWV
jgi:hypothetical protein